MQSIGSLRQNINRRLNGWKLIILVFSVIILVGFVAINYKNFTFLEGISLKIQESRLDKISSLALQGRQVEALENIQGFLKDYPDSRFTPVVLMRSGRAYQKINRPEEALAVFQKIIDEYPDYKEVSLAIYESGVIYFSLGDEEKASEYFNIILNEYSDTQAWSLVKSEYYRIEPLFGAEKYQEAIDKSYEVLGKNPGDEVVGSILFLIGKCYYNLRDYDNALLIFQKIIDEYPNDFYVPRAVYWAGIVYDELGEKEKAELYFKKLLKDYPNAGYEMARYAKERLK